MAYTYISTATDTTIASEPKFLGSVVVGTAGAAGSTVTLKDGSATVAVIDSSAAGRFPVHTQLATSLVVTTTGSPAPKVTITYT